MSNKPLTLPTTEEFTRSVSRRSARRAAVFHTMNLQATSNKAAYYDAIIAVGNILVIIGYE